MDGHRGGAEHHHEIDADFIEGWHWGGRPELTDYAKLRAPRDHHVMVSQWLIPAKPWI
jgi:hypothetical protein